MATEDRTPPSLTQMPDGTSAKPIASEGFRPVTEGPRPVTDATNHAAKPRHLPKDGASGAWIIPCLSLIAVLLIGGFQLSLMWRQNEVAAEQTRIAGRQADIMENQAALARAPISPKFVFDVSDDEFSVSNKGELVRNLEGVCVPYLELMMPEAMGKKVKLDGYYISTKGFTLRSTALYYFTPKKLLPDLYLALMPHRHTTNLLQYVEVRYTNLAGERRTERFVMDNIGTSAVPADRMPDFDVSVDIAPFCRENRLDREGVAKAVSVAVERLMKPR